MTSKDLPLRLGFTIPAANTTVEVEAPLVLWPVVTAHFQRFSQLIRSEEELELGRDGIVAAAQTLAAARVAAIGVGYTAGSFVGGAGWDAELRTRISDASGRPATTAADAIVRTLQALGSARVAVVSPYAQHVNDRLRAYLAAAGIETSALVGSPPPGPAGGVPIPEVEALALSLDRVRASAVLISCTGLRTLTIIESLERHTGLPVVTSNQAMFLTLLDLVGVHVPIKHFGSALARHAIPVR